MSSTVLTDAIRSMLESENPEVRKDVWVQLHRDFERGASNPNLRDWNELMRYRNREREKGEMHLWQFAEETIDRASHARSSAQANEIKELRQTVLRLQKSFLAGRTARRKMLPQSLADWMGEPFSYPSCVFFALDPTTTIRDDDAVIALSRCFPVNAFPHTRVKRIQMGKFHASPELLNEVNTICFVGRLGLFSGQVPDQWMLKGSRFRFITEIRPKGLPRGKLDSEHYHCILEHLGNGESPILYKTTEADGRRTDYGLVQRYMHQYGSRRYLVVRYAGCSALGTLAAAWWAAHDLVVPNPNVRVIELPRDTHREHVLEALIKVTSDVPGKIPIWEVKELELLELRLGDKAYFQREDRWGSPVPKCITIESTAPTPAQHEVDHTAKILIEGASASMRKKLQAHRTFLEVCWLAWRHDGRVDFAELLRAEGKPVNHQTLGQLRVALTTLNKRHFKGALVMHEDYCELHARLSYRFGANATSDALLDPQQPSADEPAPQLRRRTAKTNGNRSRVPLPESTDDPD